MDTKEKKAPIRGKHRRSALLRDILMPFGLSLALSRSALPGASLGWTAAAGTGTAGTAALAGSLLGYVAFLPTAQALRCCGAAILVYTLALSCQELQWFRKDSALAYCCGIVTAITGFVYQSGALWSGFQALELASEVLVSCLTCLLLRRWRPEPGEMPGREALMLWSALGVSALSGMAVPLGAASAALLTLLTVRAGAGTAAAAGALLGLTAGLGTGTAALGAALSAAGAVSGTGERRHRLERVLLFTAVGGVTALWTHGGAGTALACAAGAAVYSALPEGVLRSADRLLRAGGGATPAPVPRFSALERTGHHLEEQSRVYHSLWQHLSESLNGEELGEESAVIFERTMERVCRGCFLYSVCWERDYEGTCRDLTKVLNTMLEEGSARLTDYPEGFRRRCDRLDEFVRVSNEELYGHWARQRSRERLRESRRAVGEQYAQLSRLLGAAADELREEATEDSTGAASVRRALLQQGTEAGCSLQVDQRGRRTLELRGKGLAWLRGEEGIRLISGALGVRMEPGERFRVRQGEQLVFHECPPLSATVAVAAHRRREGQRSGDNGVWFRDEEGMLWVALCDGMGSGNAAAKDSQLLTTLLKDFLLAGVGPAAALSTLSGALGLAGAMDGGFTTVDLLGLDLFSGAAELYKLGGAPTYLRRGGLVSALSCTTLPAGLEGEAEPEESRFRLFAEDYVLLITDGVTDAQGDAWLRALLEHYEGQSPRELAQAVLSSPAAGREDDRTVVALRLSRRLGENL